MKLAIVFGTRPEIIKLSQIISLAEINPSISPILIHTGQHYSSNMSDFFLDQLQLPKPDFNLEIGSGTQAYQVGMGLIKLEEIFLREKPDMVIAQGDTNAVFSAALAATNLHIPFSHVEAGIRSFDRKMPEEINRILSDQISEYCFAPTEIAVKNLINEGISNNKIYLTGNTIVEATNRNMDVAKRSDILDRLNLEMEEYIVVTAHRAENVDNKERLLSLIRIFEHITEPIVYPIHPRTLKNINNFGFLDRINSIDNLNLIDPLGYLDFLKLCANSKLIISDSGGIQEEVTIYKKPILVIRDSTERPEILDKFGWLVGCDQRRTIERYEYIINNYAEIKKKLQNLDSPFGDGEASKTIIYQMGQL
jgi:UDP-N-acetylglucosamine 2-epimerase (non-hydrolysing)